MRERIYIFFTMDCERIRKFSPPGGPETWELSERAIQGFSEVLLAKNLSGTFFITPETAHQHQKLFLDLEKKGFELAMHLHPQAYGDLRYKDYLGGYSFEKQVEILSKAANDWKEALGRAPKTFRPGNLSANDSTFMALYTTGFRQGSISCPERELPEYKAVWKGAPPYAHHVHPNFRLICGNLDFYEIPITADRDRRTSHLQGKSPMEIRIEWGNAEDHFLTIKKTISEMIKKNIPVKTLVAVTHNYFDYKDKREPKRKVLEQVADYLWQITSELHLELRSIPFSQLHEIVDEEDEEKI